MNRESPEETTRPFSDPGDPAHWIRPRRVRITHLDLAITIDVEARRIDGVVQHHCQPIDAQTELLELDQHELIIHSVEVDGESRGFTLAPGKLLVRLAPGGHAITVRIAFTADHPLKGMYFIDPDPARGRVRMSWTQGAMEDHSWWFPCLDSPNNLSTFRVAIRHRQELLALANGQRVSLTTAADGWSTTTYQQDRSHVLYLLNVVVGDFTELDGGPAAVPVTHYLPNGRVDDGRAMFRATGFAIEWLSQFIGVPYPWQRYGHVVVHGFMWGGMENTTLTTITDRVLMDDQVQVQEDVDCDSLVVHELVHQWFGDLLTMKGWSDIWLNESFATYLEARGTAAWIVHHRPNGSPAHAADELALHLWRDRAAYFEEDHGRYRRALVTNRYNDPYELFDRVAYEKGALVLHHLRSVLGAERFQRSLTLYVQRHAHDLVETADFRQAIEDATGEPMDWFFAQWIHRPGHPTLKVRWHHDPSTLQLVVTCEQTQASTASRATIPDRLWRLPIQLCWGDDQQVHRQDLLLESACQTVVCPAAQVPRWVVLDPDGDLLAQWDEDAESTSLVARLTDARLPAHGRARAAVALSGKQGTPSVIEALSTMVSQTQVPELVRQESLVALGEMRSAASVSALRALGAQAMALPPRLRRVLAKAMGQQRGIPGAQAMADWLMDAGDAESSGWCAGDYFTARAALELPGATSLLRARLGRPSWNQRLRAGCVRGLGLSGEPAAIDEVLTILLAEREHDAVLAAACEAVGRLGPRFPIARPRCRLALERRLDHESVLVRVAATRALGSLGDGEAAAALMRRVAREPLGNARRVVRETLAQLARAEDHAHTVGDLTRRLEEAEKSRTHLENRLEALEKRLDGGTR